MSNGEIRNLANQQSTTGQKLTRQMEHQDSPPSNLRKNLRFKDTFTIAIIAIIQVNTSFSNTVRTFYHLVPPPQHGKLTCPSACQPFYCFLLSQTSSHSFPVFHILCCHFSSPHYSYQPVPWWEAGKGRREGRTKWVRMKTLIGKWRWINSLLPIPPFFLSVSWWEICIKSYYN